MVQFVNLNKKIRLKIETHVRTMITELVDTDGACDWVALGDVCEIKNGKQLSKRDCVTVYYDYIFE